MKVALLYMRENFTPAPPMGILYIATVLNRSGHQAIVIDSFPGRQAELGVTVRW